MAKRSQANVLKIKQDIREASAELEIVLAERDEAVVSRDTARAELKATQHEVETERGKISLMWESVAGKLKLAQSVRKSLETENKEVGDKLSFTKAQLSLVQGLMRDAIERLTIEAAKQPSGMLAGLMEAMKSSLKRVMAARDAELQALEIVKGEHAKLNEQLKALQEQADGFAGKVEEKKELEAQIAELEKEISGAASTIEDIARRDHDSKVLEYRMTKEYKADREKYLAGLKK